MRALLAIALLATRLATASTGPDATGWDTIERELAGPIELVLQNGARLRGYPDAAAGGRLQLATAEGSGEIVHTLEPGEIRDVRLPGDSYPQLAVEWLEAGDTQNALRLMELLFEQRVRLLPFLDASESRFFIHYLRSVLESGDAARAVIVTERLRPQIAHPDALRALDDAVLEAYHHLALHAEAVPLANAWVSSRQPYGPSAIGYYVLAAADLRAGRPARALETALGPIVFSSTAPMDYLGHCYATAADAALRLREPAYAHQLFREMHERRLHWPDDPELAGALEELEALSREENPSDRTNRSDTTDHPNQTSQ